MCSRLNGASEPCLCHAIHWDSLLPFCLGELGTHGVQPSCLNWIVLPPAGAKTWGMAGLNRVWDGTSGGGHMWKLMSKYAYVGHFGIFPGIKIDSNRWAHQVWACLISLQFNVVTTWTSVYYCFYYQVLDIYMIVTIAAFILWTYDHESWIIHVELIWTRW